MSDEKPEIDALSKDDLLPGEARSQEAEINRLLTENETMSRELQRLQGEHTAMSGVARTIELKGQAASPIASGKILIEPTTRRGVAFVYRLPRTNRYELWMSGPNGENRTRAASFDTRRGNASVMLENVPSEPALFTITATDGKVFLSSTTTP